MELLLGAVAVISLMVNILQYLRSRDRDIVQLKVVPVRVFGVGGLAAYESVAIRVTNLSAFSVYVSEVGFELRDSENRWALLDPSTVTGLRYPLELAARRTVTFHFPPGAHADPKMKQAVCAYAHTECGRTAKGKSKAMSNLAVVSH